MVNLMARLGGRGRHNGANAIVHLAREVVGRRRTIQNATQEVRNAVILDALADEDFRTLDTTVAERFSSDREFAQTLARLSYAAARAKGFDRCVVDAALRLDSLIPVDDPVHERDKLLRDAYNSAQKASYIRGGRLALGRLGRRAVEAGDLERARVLLHQQLDLGPAKDDTAAEVDSALVLGDILRREGDDDAAQTFYRRAASAADRLDYPQGVAEALVRQIDTAPPASPEIVTALQHQALDAARRTGDQSLEARVLVGLAETLVESERLDDATPYFQQALDITRETADLALEARCVTALARAHHRLGHALDAVEAERSALGIEERLGNRPAAAAWALTVGMSELRLRNAESAVEAFEKARLLGSQIGDAAIEQRAEGNLGIAYTLLGHGPETIDHLGRAIALARQSQDPVQEAEWVSSLGQAHWMFGQVEDAIRLTSDAISLTETTRNGALQAESYMLLGQIYAAQRETIRARDCYTRALQLNRDLGETGDQVTTLAALGTLAADTGQFTQASQLFDQALNLALTGGDRSTATVLYGRIGSLAQKRGDPRAALTNYQQSAELAQALGDARLISRALQHLATAQDVMGDPAAVTSYERAVTAADDIGDIRGGITMRLNMGMLIGRMPEPGAAEDAIGWLSDAANYALEAGSAYTDLRKQAEDLIQELGGGPDRGSVTQFAQSAGYEEVDSRYRGDPYVEDESDEDDDPVQVDPFDDAPLDPRRSGDRYRVDDDDRGLVARDRDGFDPGSRRTSHAAAEDRDEDEQFLGRPERDSLRRETNRRPAGYVDDDRSSDPYGVERSEDRRHDAANFQRDAYTSVDRSREYDPDDRNGRSARDRYRFEDDVEADQYAQGRDTGSPRSYEDGPWLDQENPYRSDRRDGSRRYEPGGSHDDDYGDGAGQVVERRQRSRTDSYVEPDRYDYPDDDLPYDDRDAGSQARSREQPPDDGSFSERVRFEFDRYDGDRSDAPLHDDDRERGRSGYQDGGGDFVPQHRSGRNERAGRRESGRRANPNRGLDDEPSEPAPSSRRGGLQGLFARYPQTGWTARSNQRTRSLSEDGTRGVPPTGPFERPREPEHPSIG